MSISGNAQAILPNAIAQVTAITYQMIVTAVNNVRGIYIHEVISENAVATVDIRVGGAGGIEFMASKANQSSSGASVPDVGLSGWIIPAGQSLEMKCNTNGKATLSYRIL